jgi:DNA gyrase subunit A
MPLPENEAKWGEMYGMFATASGDVRRNRLSDFVDVKANGKMAMKLGKGDRLIGVQTCSEADDVLLAAANGQAIRFATADVRVFSGRASTGVRGIKLGEGDHVISMSILRHVDAETEERVAYLRMSKRRRGVEEEAAAAEAGDEEGGAAATTVTLSPERYAELEAKEEFILTVTANGFGKRSSAYEYRITGRGGSGIAGIEKSERNGQVVASFPVRHRDQIMLVTDRGQLIRCPVDDIRIAGRRTQGVVLFKVEEGEKVVSVVGLADETSGPEGNGEAPLLDGNSNGNGGGAAHG